MTGKGCCDEIFTASLPLSVLSASPCSSGRDEYGSNANEC